MKASTFDVASSYSPFVVLTLRVRDGRLDARGGLRSHSFLTRSVRTTKGQSVKRGLPSKGACHGAPHSPHLPRDVSRPGFLHEGVRLSEERNDLRRHHR